MMLLEAKNAFFPRTWFIKYLMHFKEYLGHLRARVPIELRVEMISSLE